MPPYREPSTKGKIYFFGLWLIILSLGLFLKHAETLPPVANPHTNQMAIYDTLYLHLAIWKTAMYLGLIALATYIATSSRTHMEFPPPNIPVPFRQKVICIKNPKKIWIIYGILVIAWVSKIIVSFYFWYSVHVSFTNL